MPTTEEHVSSLVEQARSKAVAASSCVPAGPDELMASLVGGVVSGWSVQLTAQNHGVECWHASVKLHPAGRSSTEDDWGTLGQLLALLVKATGHPPTAPMPAPITPIETTHPNSALHWVWHSDGSAVDSQVVTVMRAALYDMQRSLPMPEYRVRPGRNDPCPCGSGKKYKKCHGLLN